MPIKLEVWGDYACFTRPEMKVERELIVFKHDNELGCAPSWKIFETVRVTRKNAGDSAPARAYRDYTVTVDEDALPAGVTCRRMG